MRKILWSLITYAAWQYLTKSRKQKRRSVRSRGRYASGGRAGRE